MNSKKTEYLLGIDGGGTKTEFLLTDINGNEIRRLILGCSNPVNVGIEKTKALLRDGISDIADGLDMNSISAYAGIAGAKTADNEKQIYNFLSEFGFAFFSCGSDIELALEMCLGDGDGTAVIMGTGIVAFSRNVECLYRTGGRGYMIDKGGSGFHFGSAVLHEAFCAMDGREGSEIILSLVEKQLGCSLEEGSDDIYKGGASYIASFAPVIFKAFALEDKRAAEIIDDNAKEVASVIKGALKISGNAEKKVVICGGLSKQREILSPFIKKYLDADVRLEFNCEPMINAAITKAKRLLGV